MILSLINTNLQLNMITLDNASNNSMLCKIVEAVHNQRGYAGFWDAGENQLLLVFYLVSSFIVESEYFSSITATGVLLMSSTLL